MTLQEWWFVYLCILYWPFVSVVQAELNDEQSEIDVDVMVQLLAPLLNSQHFLIEELKTAYRSVTCQNGFVFVFAEVGPVAFLSVEN